MYKINYLGVVIDADLRKISKTDKKKIKTGIENKLMVDPALYSLSLRRPLAGYRKMRVGKYRVIFSFNEKKKTCLVVGIRHRENIYEEMNKRVG